MGRLTTAGGFGPRLSAGILRLRFLAALAAAFLYDLSLSRSTMLARGHVMTEDR